MLKQKAFLNTENLEEYCYFVKCILIHIPALGTRSSKLSKATNVKIYIYMYICMYVY